MDIECILMIVVNVIRINNFLFFLFIWCVLSGVMLNRIGVNFIVVYKFFFFNFWYFNRIIFDFWLIRIDFDGFFYLLMLEIMYNKDKMNGWKIIFFVVKRGINKCKDVVFLFF